MAVQPVRSPAYSLREVLIPESVRHVYEVEGAGRRLTRISKLNVFIGPNNVGKSRLLRELFRDVQEKLTFSTTDESSEDFRSQVSLLLNGLRQLTPELQKSAEGFRQTLESLYPRCRQQRLKYVKVEGEVSAQSIEQLREDSELAKALSKVCRVNVVAIIRKLTATLAGQTQTAKVTSTSENIDFTRIYIPALRSLRSPVQGKDYYRERAIVEYFEDDASLKRQKQAHVPLKESEIITGGDVYFQVRELLLGDLPERTLIQDFQRYLSDTFYNGVSVTLIPRSQPPRHGLDDVLFVKIGDEGERPIHELGDGIQQIITLTLPLFVHRERRLLLFIEEPELYLHPGFQRAFIDACTGNIAPQSQIFVATHSHQFIDATIDRDHCTAFRFKKTLSASKSGTMEARYIVGLASSMDFAVLRELGVRNSSVLLSNCTIWVEGITDRKYVRHFLSLLIGELASRTNGKTVVFRPLEDLHFSFVEYAGSNVVHWTFLEESGPKKEIVAKRVCPHIFLIADKDDTSEEGKDEKSARQRRLASELNENFHQLPCREIENLLTPSTIAAIIKQYEESESYSVMVPEQDEYRDCRIGDAIENKFVVKPYGGKRTGTPPYALENGELRDKHGFCDRAIMQLKCFSQLSRDAQMLAVKVYRFIAEQNGQPSCDNLLQELGVV